MSKKKKERSRNEREIHREEDNGVTMVAGYQQAKIVSIHGLKEK